MQEDREYDFPDELDSIVGKRMMLRLKLNEYNKKFPHASISVVSFMMCENLLDKFDEVDDQVLVIIVIQIRFTVNVFGDYSLYWHFSILCIWSKILLLICVERYAML